MTYFQEGGFSMWLILLAAMATVAVAIATKGERRSRVLAVGSQGTLLLGVFGMATGMEAVRQNIGRFADKGAAVAEGLGELSNNGTFATLLALVLGIAALVTAPKTKAAAA
jgi:hypothetical protein